MQRFGKISSLRLLIIALSFLIFAFFLPSPALAQSTSAEFMFSPESGFVVVGESFFVDIELDSGGEEIVSASSAVYFDTDYLALTKVNKGKIFCKYPDSATDLTYASDNSTGYVLVTGLADGTTDCPYYDSTENKDNTFARLHFRSKKKGSTKLEFITSSDEEKGFSAVYINGSPPTQSLNPNLDSASYTITDPKVTLVPEDLPATGFFDNIFIVLSALLFIGSLGFFIATIIRKRS